MVMDRGAGMKPLSFKSWLKEKVAIDYDDADVTPQTKTIWHEAYSNYLEDWSMNSQMKRVI